MLQKVKKFFKGLKCEHGWFNGEEFRLFNVGICEVGDMFFTIIGIQIAKFIFSIYYDGEV